MCLQTSLHPKPLITDRLQLDNKLFVLYNKCIKFKEIAMSEYKGYTQAGNKASQKYKKENLEEVRFWVQKGKKDEYKAKAEAKGMSLTAYIVSLIEQDK